jgi:hypothetical protein
MRYPTRFFASAGLSNLLILIAVTSLPGQTNSPGTNSALQLLPPYGELAPTFWEQYGARLIVAAVGLLLLAAFSIWLRFRPKPPVILPVEVQARQALEALRQRPEDGALLSEVSRILRRYVIIAFQLPPAELTTAELRHAVSDHPRIGPELSIALADFLRRCDERKFSPASLAMPFGATARALELVGLAEARRALLRQVAATDNKEHPASAT